MKTQYDFYRIKIGKFYVGPISSMSGQVMLVNNIHNANQFSKDDLVNSDVLPFIMSHEMLFSIEHIEQNMINQNVPVEEFKNVTDNKTDKSESVN